jgi:hypothetical protein
MARARQQIQDIAELARTDVWDSSLLQHAAEDMVKSGDLYSLGSEGIQEFVAVNDPTASHSFFPDFRGPGWVIDGKVRDLNKNSLTSDFPSVLVSDTPPSAILLDAPRTLQDFKDIWDATAAPHQLKFPRHLSKMFYALNGEVGQSVQDVQIEQISVKWSKPKTPSIGPSTTFVPFYLTLLDKELRKKLPIDQDGYVWMTANFPHTDVWMASHDLSFKYPSSGRAGFFRIGEYEGRPFDAQRPLIQRFPKDRRPNHGTFDYSFRDLNAYTKNYQGLEIRQFDTILASEQSRTGESFEAFGIKFPAQGTTRWGILVVLGLQLYLFIHLRELAGKLRVDDPGWDVAWIGVYDWTLSKAVFAFSAFVLPVGAITALGIRGLYVSDFSWIYRFILGMGMLAASTLAVAGWKYSQKLYELGLVPASPSSRRLNC